MDSRRNRERLLSGHDWEFIDDQPKLTEDELAALWEELRGELLHNWIHGGNVEMVDNQPSQPHPGTRPWAFWKWDAPAPRQFVEEHHTREGLANLRRILGADYVPMIPEAEVIYLRRHGLLTPEERRLDAAGKLERECAK